jgi:carbamoyltransferase
MKLLSLHLFSHDANISYFDGNTVKYVNLERITQRKHDSFNWWLPLEGFGNYLNVFLKNQFNITLEDVDDVVYCDAKIYKDLYLNIFKKYKCNLEEIDHHYAHILSTSMFCEEDPNISITMDGEGSKKSWTVYKKNNLIESGLVDEFGSIGHGISWLSGYLNVVSEKQSYWNLEGPGKLMSLQSYGNIDEEYLKILKKYNIYDIGVHMNYREFSTKVVTYTNKNKLFSFENFISYKGSKEKADKYKLDWAKTIHHRCGEIIVDLFKKYATPDDVIGYSGGVAQNIIWNTELKKQFPKLVILPHCGDEGLSLGGIEFLRRKYNLSKMKMNDYPFIQNDVSPNENISDENIDIIAEKLAEGKIVLWYQGFGEIGPRALGNRSILMDPRIANGKDIINKIKNRELYRPFGASVLSEHKKELFDLDFENPHMLYVGKTKNKNMKAITHIDETCRAQTVSGNSSFRKLLTSFYKKTGCPVLLNTSLNVSGKPIAGKIEDVLPKLNKVVDISVCGNSMEIRN